MNSDDSGCIPTNSSRGQQCPDEIRNLGTGSFPVLFENKGSDYLKQLWLERGGGGCFTPVHLYVLSVCPVPFWPDMGAFC